MQEIASYKIELNRQLKTKNLLEIHQFSILNDIKIYLYHEDAVADAHNLPELLSFFLINPHEEVLLILEGPHAKQIYPQLLPLIQQTAQTA